MKKVYLWVMRNTDNLQNIPPDIVSRKPGILKVFRILSDKGQIPFAKTLGISQSTLSALERGSSKVLSEAELGRISSSISKCKFELLPASVFLDRAAKVSVRGRFSGEYARRMAKKSAPKSSVRSAQMKKPTPQERQIATLLRKNALPFEEQAVVESDGIIFVVDFVIPDAKDPRIFIEAKNLQTRYRKKASICELAYKSIKFKQRHPGAKTIAVVIGILTGTEEKILLREFDGVSRNPSQQSLINLVNKLWLE